MLLRNREGQNTAEYAVLIGLVVAAAIAMQTYVKRGLQGRIEQSTQLQPTIAGTETGITLTDVGNTTELSFQTGQYEPYYLESRFATGRADEVDTKVKEGGEVERNINREEIARKGAQKFHAPVDQ
ncbi:MAG: hypothetical protein PHR44_08135 [Candidatus Omnitrophica bacterium]|nr:hypothetical protein [Candidatus Omnitrophota bacterium]